MKDADSDGLHASSLLFRRVPVLSGQFAIAASLLYDFGWNLRPVNFEETDFTARRESNRSARRENGQTINLNVTLAPISSPARSFHFEFTGLGVALAYLRFSVQTFRSDFGDRNLRCSRSSWLRFRSGFVGFLVDARFCRVGETLS